MTFQVPRFPFLLFLSSQHYRTEGNHCGLSSFLREKERNSRLFCCISSSVAQHLQICAVGELIFLAPSNDSFQFSFWIWMVCQFALSEKERNSFVFAPSVAQCHRSQIMQAITFLSPSLESTPGAIQRRLGRTSLSMKTHQSVAITRCRVFHGSRG